jgi:pimeloyl-ACP methyl ester carboxylesterase
MIDYLWTAAGGRLKYLKDNEAVNWLFLPGGPGLGSEAIAGLSSILQDKIPGLFWLLDLPGDGSNRLDDKNISNWRSSIREAVQALGQVILVAHSTPGMYVQTMPELEEHLKGLVLIGSAPDASWQKTFAAYAKEKTTAAIITAEKNYQKHPSDDHLRQVLMAAAGYCFVNEQSLNQGKALFASIPVNFAAHEQAAQMFDAEHYQATWIPKQLPTLIMAGAEDFITPLSHFKNNPIYQRKNIMMREVDAAGHYPWFENPKEVLSGFKDFLEFSH